MHRLSERAIRFPIQFTKSQPEHDPETEIVLESETANESSSTSGSNENKPLAADAFQVL
jgi:hypothetical protein